MADSAEIYVLEHDRKHEEPSTSGFRHVLDGIIDFCAGTAGGTASVYVGQPLDTVKVKMQTFPVLYPNALRCFRQTLTKEGVTRGLYAGTVPALAANIGENAVLFAAYGYCQKLVGGGRPVSELSPLENALAGSLAAGFSTFALCPTELVKCKLQAMREMSHNGGGGGGGAAAAAATAGNHGRDGRHIGPWTVMKEILRTEGVRGMFRGLVPTAAREVPGYFFFFGGYEATRKFLAPESRSGDDIGVVKTAFAGGVGGMLLWTAIFPADVAKSRIQVQGHGTLVSTLTHILKNDGFRALYKGLGPTLVRTFFATGALFVAVESTRRGLNAVTPSWV